MSIKEEQGAFGPFRVLHQIGVGALGPVFRTYEPARDRLVAVKVFRLDITPEQAQALAGELSKAAEAGLFHPSIVEPVAAGVQGTVAYRAEEYVAAETLDVALRHYAPAPMDKALPFITQLAGAIDFARAAGVGHGSLHPRDIFVTPDEARATGFGVVDALERVGLRAPVRRPYSAPERIDGNEWGTPADVFALAAVSYELLTGRRPSGTGDEIGNLSGAVVGAQADAVLAVLARAMHANPAARYQTALAFASALEAASREQRPPASAIPVVPAPPVASPVPPVVVPASAIAAPLAADASIRQPPREADGDHSEIEDDITDERDEDDAHHSLMLDERDREQAAESAPLLAEDDPEAEADREMIETAALASMASDDAGERYRDEFQTPRADGAGRADRAGEAGHGPSFGARTAPSPPPRYAPAVVPAERSRLLPLAAMLAIGLLVGFAVGYGVGSREPDSRPERSTAAAPVSPSGSAPGGRDFSEQAVAPPQAARQSPQPSATPPPIPSEAPVEPRPEDRRIASSGRLVVRSDPPRAGVLINGRWSGRTPLAVERVPFGKYTVRVVQPGYAPAEEAFALSPDDPARTLSLRLRPQSQAARGSQRPSPSTRAGQPAGDARSGARTPATPARDVPTPSPAGSFTGAIYVDSRPQGARVFVDGKAVGTTPLTLPDVPIGSHVVRLELPDHRPWTASRQVTSGRTERITGSLERIR